MKYFVVTIPKGPNGYIYPSNYQSEIGNYNKGHLYFPEGDTTKLLLCIRDADSAGIARTNVVEITESEAKAISEANETRMERITDEAKLQRLAIKARIGMKLDDDELDAIDPSSSVPGIERTKILADRIPDLITEEIG